MPTWKRFWPAAPGSGSRGTAQRPATASSTLATATRQCWRSDLTTSASSKISACFSRRVERRSDRGVPSSGRAYSSPASIGLRATNGSAVPTHRRTTRLARSAEAPEEHRPRRFCQTGDLEAPHSGRRGGCEPKPWRAQMVDGPTGPGAAGIDEDEGGRKPTHSGAACDDRRSAARPAGRGGSARRVVARSGA